MLGRHAYLDCIHSESFFPKYCWSLLTILLSLSQQAQCKHWCLQDTKDPSEYGHCEHLEIPGFTVTEQIGTLRRTWGLSSSIASLFVNRRWSRRAEDDVHAGLIQTPCCDAAGHDPSPMIWKQLASTHIKWLPEFSLSVVQTCAQFVSLTWCL